MSHLSIIRAWKDEEYRRTTLPGSLNYLLTSWILL
jgi:hypothetical protein